MTKKEIMQVILDNYEMPKFVIKRQLRELGVKDQEFELAWKAVKAGVKPDQVEVSAGEKVMTVLLVVMSLLAVLINVLFAMLANKYQFSYNASRMVNLVDYISNYSDCILGLLIGASLLKIRVPVLKHIVMSFFGFGVLFLWQTWGIQPLFFVVGSVILLLSLALMMVYYAIKFRKALMLLLIEVLVVILINVLMLGLFKVGLTLMW